MAETVSYFALLGVSEDVSQDELEARYQQLADHLASPAIPAHLREWARRQAALVDEAYAVLADPERRTAVRRERQDSAAAVTPARKAASDRNHVQGPAGPGAELHEETPEGADLGAGTGRASPRREQSRSSIYHALLSLRSRSLFLGVLIGLVVLGSILLGRYGLPGRGTEDVTPPTEQEDTLVALDTERVAELMAAEQHDPNNPEVLFELGETFFLAGEWQSAIDWFTRLLAVDAGNIHALTDVGTSNFNLGRFEEAEVAWLAVLELDPDDVQGHYNLGFLYANAEPRDLAAARREWQTVVELAPDSDLARTAQVHLDGLLEEAEDEAPLAPPEEAGGAGETD